MTDKDFLTTQTRLARERLRRDSAMLEQELERALGPLVREHPRKSVAAGAAAGLVVGRMLAPAAGRPAGRDRRGAVRGAVSFIRDTGVFALRSAIVGALLPRSGGTRPTEPSDS